MPPNPDQPPESHVFAPPDGLDVRRHGPRGYVDDEHYKSWLRDEFTYRCLHCGCREVWFPDGDRSFSVEHIHPTSIAPRGLTDYDTLVYACCQCNAARGAILLPVEPTAGMRHHMEVSSDGTIRGLTPEGKEMIRICRRDRPNLLAFRRLILDVLRLLDRKRDREAAELRRRYLGYPANLPDLSKLKPGGNSRPEGIQQSAFARRERGELPEVY
jgi:hypothetical protein